MWSCCFFGLANFIFFVPNLHSFTSRLFFSCFGFHVAFIVYTQNEAWKKPKAWSDVVGACHTSSPLEIITSSGWKRGSSRHSSATKKTRPILLATATLTGGKWVGFRQISAGFFCTAGRLGVKFWKICPDPGTRNDAHPEEVFHCAAFRLLAGNQGLDFRCISYWNVVLFFIFLGHSLEFVLCFVLFFGLCLEQANDRC